MNQFKQLLNLNMYKARSQSCQISYNAMASGYLINVNIKVALFQ